MREHMGLFRGKRTDSGEWVEGNLWRDPDLDIANISWFEYYNSANGLQRDYNSVDVDPDTVGECAGGLTDKNGKLIFEGDIVKTHYANAKKSGFVEVVVFHNGRFCAEGNIAGNGKSWAQLWDGVPHVSFDKSIYMDSVEIIGNIHDNPGLWKGGEADE